MACILFFIFEISTGCRIELAYTLNPLVKQPDYTSTPDLYTDGSVTPSA